MMVTHLAGVAFGMAGVEGVKIRFSVDIVYLSVDSWNGQKKLQLEIEDMPLSP